MDHRSMSSILKNIAASLNAAVVMVVNGVVNPRCVTFTSSSKTFFRKVQEEAAAKLHPFR